MMRLSRGRVGAVSVAVPAGPRDQAFDVGCAAQPGLSGAGPQQLIENPLCLSLAPSCPAGGQVVLAGGHQRSEGGERHQTVYVQKDIQHFI